MIYSNMRLNESKFLEVAENYYAPIEEWTKKLPSEKHLELCKCISKRRKNLMFTGLSACAICGIPRLDPFEMRPHCIACTRKHADIICWRERTLDQNARIVNGLLVASPTRIICDLAKYDSTYSLLTSINHCLYKNYFSMETLLEELNEGKYIVGKNKIKQIFRVATNKCESPLETLAWIKINNEGFILPEQQVTLYDKNTFIGRVDMSWEVTGERIILELDGMNKYKDHEAFRLEKIRENKLSSCGYRIIRATWKDVTSGELIKRLENEGIPRRAFFKRSIIKNA